MRHLFAAALLGFLLTGQSAHAEEVLRIGTEGAYTPWNRTSPAGELEGFEIDLANAVCERMAVRCEYTAYDWEGIFPALLAGQFDAVMSGVAITQERKKQMAFTRPYAVPPLYFISRRDSPLQSLKTLSEVSDGLKGKRVGVQIGTASVDFLQERFGHIADIVAYANHDELQLDLVSGRIDAAFSRMLTWQEFMKSAAGHGFQVFGPALTGQDYAGFGEGVGMALPLGSPWQERLDTALTAVQQDGTLRDISLKWFETDAYLPKP